METIELLTSQALVTNKSSMNSKVLENAVSYQQSDIITVVRQTLTRTSQLYGPTVNLA